MELMWNVCGRLRQRYVLLVLLFFGATFCSLNLITFTILLKSLLYTDRLEYRESACPSAKDPHYNQSLGVEEFRWGTQMQISILSAWNLGNALFRLPTGLIVDRYGAKTLFGYAVFVPGVCSLLTPIAARTSPYLMLVNRIVMGMFCSGEYPAVAWFAARWFPSRHLFGMFSIVLLGFPFAFISRYYFNFHESSENWTTTYYVIGGLTILFVYFWQELVYDDPFEHPYISLSELEMLADKVPMYAHDWELEPGWSWPWRDMLTSKSIWTLALAETGLLWYFAIVTRIVPEKYFGEVHQFNFLLKVEFGTFLYLLNACMTVTAGVVADKLIAIRCYSVTHIAKMYYGVASIFGSLLLIGLVVQAQCRLTTALIYYTGATVCLGIGRAVGLCAAVHMAPNFAGTVYALVTLPGHASLPLLFKMNQRLTKHRSLSEWRTVSFLHAAIILLATAVFIKAGDCHVQPWNEPYKKQRRQVDYESEAGPSDKPDSEGKDEGSLDELGRASLQGDDSLTAAQRRVADIKSAHSLIRMSKSRSSISRRRSDFPQTSASQVTKARLAPNPQANL